VDIMTFGSEKEFRLGAVSRRISEAPDLFTPAAEPMSPASCLRRFPNGPAIDLREPARMSEEDMDAERWDGLY
jgi:hypothetical protein